MITSRPSRSTVEVRVGSFADGSPRLQKYHWSHCKIAHLREDAVAAERPGPGRPKTSAHPEASITTDGNNKNDADEKINKVKSAGRVEIQTVAGKFQNEPVVSNRNKGPVITDNMFQQWSPDLLGIPSSTNHSNSNSTLRRSSRASRNPNPQYIDATCAA